MTHFQIIILVRFILLIDMCQIDINRLARAGMLVIDDASITLHPTNTGLLMAKYCVAFDTMKLFTQVKLVSQ